MELGVSPLWFAADVFLFVIIGYAAYYALKRVSRYGEPLDGLINITAISLVLATIGRALDVVDDFTISQGTRHLLLNVEFVLYFFAISGTIYGIMRYVSSVEKKILPSPKTSLQRSKLVPGVFLLLAEPGGLLPLLKTLKSPTLLITRNPEEWSGLGSNVSVLWVTPSSDRGVSPAKLHVILEAAVKFLRGGGRVVVVDCVETFLIYNEFRSVFRFLTTLKDNVLATGGTLLLALGRDTLDKKEFNVLIREFVLVEDIESLFRTSS